jgi:hypothetical protein
VALAGVLGEKWSLAFLRTYMNEHRPLRPQEIVEDYPAHQASFNNWVKQGRLDVVSASVELLKRHIQRQSDYEAIASNSDHRSNIEAFFSDLPGDLQRQVQQWLEERSFYGLAVSPRPRRRRV